MQQENKQMKSFVLFKIMILELEIASQKLIFRIAGEKVWPKDYLERLLFDILPRFANLHTLDLGGNNIESFQSIEYRIIKKLEPPQTGAVMPDNNKLRKLELTLNPVTGKVYNNPRETETATLHDPKEV